MSRYIDAVLAKSKAIRGLIDGYEAFDSYIDSLPTEDVAPVRHGKWIEQEVWHTLSPRGRDIQYTIKVCSECGKSNGRAKKPYCPECGAKMDLE